MQNLQSSSDLLNHSLHFKKVPRWHGYPLERDRHWTKIIRNLFFFSIVKYSFKVEIVQLFKTDIDLTLMWLLILDKRWTNIGIHTHIVFFLILVFSSCQKLLSVSRGSATIALTFPNAFKGYTHIHIHWVCCIFFV